MCDKRNSIFSSYLMQDINNKSSKSPPPRCRVQQITKIDRARELVANALV